MIFNFNPQNTFGDRMKKLVHVPHEMLGCAIMDGPTDLWERGGIKTELWVIAMYAILFKHVIPPKNMEYLNEEEEKLEGELQESKTVNL